jgi:hypothetical protein
MFRQKNFGKVSFRLKKWGSKALKTAKENPLSTIGTVSSIGFGSFNASVALNRSKNEKKFQKEQIEATNRLTEAIEKDEKAKTKLKTKRRLIKRSQKPYTRDYYLPKPVEDLKDKSLETINIKRKS